MEQYPYEAIRVNTLGTQIVADAAHKHCAEVFVFISTDKAVNPTNVMGATKRAAEMYVKGINKHSDTKFITTRFGNVLGSNGSVVPLFKRQIQQGGPITVTHPDVIRYFMTIPEACELVLEASCFGKGGEVFVFDMGEPVKIVDLARRMIKLSGLKEGRDISISFTGLRPGEKLYEELLTDKEKSQPTHHPKIMIARLESASFEHTQAQLHLLKEVLQKENDRERMVLLLKELVPEFVSNNSEFEKLDYTHEKPTLGQLT
jgi:FlaA1/EpsC-like NDP-sugar epimerase